MKRILLALLAATMVVASGTTAFAHRGHDDGGKAKERVFTLAPDPASSPEGIDFDKRTRSFYVSITGLSPATSGGDIYRGRLGSDKVEPFIPWRNRQERGRRRGARAASSTSPAARPARSRSTT